MAGYSGTPLPKKLGIKDHYRVLLDGAPPDVKAELNDSLSTCEIVTQARAPLDFVMLFVKSQADLQARVATLARQLAPAGMLWVSWPRKRLAWPVT